MKLIRVLVAFGALFAASNPSIAALTVYVSHSTFNAAVLRSSTDGFDDLSPNEFFPSPLDRSGALGSFQATARLTSSAERLFALPDASGVSTTWLTTDLAESSIVFEHFSPGVDSIAGTFFLTDFAGTVAVFSSVTVTAVFASETSTQTVYLTPYDPPTSAMAFLGFASPGDPLLSLAITATQAGNVPLWPTVDNLILASTSTSTSPVPEPGSGWLLVAGLYGLAAVSRARGDRGLRIWPNAQLFEAAARPPAAAGVSTF